MRDMWTLASADIIIGSSASTFGQCASGLLGSERRVIMSKSKQRAQLADLKPFQCLSGGTGICKRHEIWQKLLRSCNFINRRLLDLVHDQMSCTYRNDGYIYYCK